MIPYIVGFLIGAQGFQGLISYLLRLTMGISIGLLASFLRVI